MAVFRILILVLTPTVLIAGCGRLRYAPLDGPRVDAGPSIDAPSDANATDASFDTPRMEDSNDAPATDDAGTDTGSCSPCTIFPLCGCSPTLTCRIQSSSGMTICEGFAGVGDGELCNARQECAPGLSCSKFPGRAFPGACLPYCRDDADCTAPSHCGQIGSTTAIGICTAACDPIGLTGCPGGLLCAWYSGVALPSLAVTYAATCSVPGGGPAGTPCTATTPADCQPGTTCIANVCRNLCDRSLPASCATGTCTALPAPSFDGARTIGACM